MYTSVIHIHIRKVESLGITVVMHNCGYKQTWSRDRYATALGIG